MEFVYLFLGFIGFIVSVYIAKWAFRMDEVVKQLQYQNALMIRMLKKQGASNEEIRDSLIISHKPELLLKD
jgi:hypothetical protein